MYNLIKKFNFQALRDPSELKQLDQDFLQFLNEHAPALYLDLIAYRHNDKVFRPLAESELLIACAPFLEDFLAALFEIEQDLLRLRNATLMHKPIFAFKSWFVQRQAKRRLAKADDIESFLVLDAWLTQALLAHDLLTADRELAIANLAQVYLQANENYLAEIEMLTRWCIRALSDADGQAAVKGWVSFHFPKRLDYANLVPLQPVVEDAIGRLEGLPEHRRHRDGFKLTDARMNSRQVMNEIDYCVYCHDKEGDFCSKGFPVKKGEPELGLRLDPLGEVETGCPLEEKISEMHVLKRDGYSLAALAMIMVDNPMCPATGHRICNDCMKSCIYQKQEPVNIPQAETGILTDILNLPWGVEIYDLLARWNPLRKTQWVAKPYNGKKVLIMGLGPAGFTLAHHLLMEGFAVVGVDGLKIEPPAQKLLDQPIYSYQEIREALDERIMTGFGGVAEYGITVRWDKNFLKLIYLSLSRRPYFQAFGNVRFGGTLTVEDAWQLGFDHMAIAVGAGLPKELALPGSLAPGMRQANDFLMALQLTGAAKKNSLANLQVRLPAVIIGGGLTGVDTATEVQAYYIAQVEKTLARYQKLAAVWGEARLREQFSDNEFAILNELLQHGLEVLAEREHASQANRLPELNALIRKWGGVTIAYRGLLRESPAYRRNHEEIMQALDEGIYYAEGLSPKAVSLDQYGHVEGLISEARIYDEQGQWITSDETYTLPARSIFLATGAKPNIAYEFEHRGTFHREGSEYQAYDLAEGQLKHIPVQGHIKTPNFGAFTSYEKDGHRVTFLGDTHPLFHGNVVRAIASAKRTYPKILQALAPNIALGNSDEYSAFAAKMSDQFQACVQAVKRHTPSVVELIVYAPLAARNFQPGQFYRVQNFETQAQIIGETKLQTEAVALLASAVDKAQGIISLMVLEQGTSTRLFATMRANEPIAIMGPTGVRTKIPHDVENVLVIGGRLGAAQIRTVGPALRAAGNKVLYIAGFQTAAEVYCQSELEAAADKIIWITQTGAPVVTRRPQDRAVTGDFMAVLLQYATGELDGLECAEIPLQTIDRILVIGTRKLLRLMQEARQTFLKNYCKDALVIASVFGPMQCMLKGVCAQCLNWQIDPLTGKRTKAVFTCSWQDQPLDMVDLDNLDDRLAQNRSLEILTNLWLDYLFAHYQIEHV